MKYKITDADSYKIKVEYDDGSWAQIPTAKDMILRDYLLNVQAFQPKSGVSTDDLPIKVGDEGTVGEIPEDPTDGTPVFDYRTARSEIYPTAELQAEAAYDARNGDDTLQKGLDNNIALIKAKFPKNDTVLTWAQWEAARKELTESSEWFGDNGEE